MTEIQKQKWAAMVVLALQKRYNVQNECFLILGGGNYTKYLNLPHTVQPLKGLSLGNRLHYLKTHI